MPAPSPFSKGNPLPQYRLIPVARILRQNQTDAEKLLWSRLRARQMESAKFVRQYPIGTYITDFACRSLKLVIELDGGQHADNPADAERMNVLESSGYRVLRFWNNEVLSNVDGVLQVIAHAIRAASNSDILSPHPDPLPVGERE